MGGVWPGPEANNSTVAVIMTVHNRREQTLECLASLKRQLLTGVEVGVFVTDDGSVDGTGCALERLTGVTVIEGDGNLFWAGGMAIAERRAVATQPTWLLWLNDDVVLDPTALADMLAGSNRHPNSVIVGATRDPNSGIVNYGGNVRLGKHPMKVRLLGESPADQLASTFNGNCVLIPRHIRAQVGPIDGLFEHAMADTDYGYRTTAAGFSIVQIPGTVGVCARNPKTRTSDATFFQRLRYARSPKAELPRRSHKRFLKRHGGRAWRRYYAAGRLNVVRKVLLPQPPGTLKFLLPKR